MFYFFRLFSPSLFYTFSVGMLNYRASTETCNYCCSAKKERKEKERKKQQRRGEREVESEGRGTAGQPRAEPLLRGRLPINGGN